MSEIMRFHLARAVAAGLELGYACGVDIEPDHRRALAAEGDGDWQPDISEADDGEHSTVRHNLTLMPVRLKFFTSKIASVATSIEFDQVAWWRALHRGVTPLLAYRTWIIDTARKFNATVGP